MNNMESNQIKALIQLLSSESESYGELLKKELASIIKKSPNRVQEVIATEFNSLVPPALINAMEEICWEDLTKSFTDFSAKINPELEEGLYLLSKFVNPSVSAQEVADHLDYIAREMRSALLNSKDTTEIAAAMQHFFYRSLKFMVLPANLSIKELSFARFLTKRSGACLCMACVYTLVGQRYGLDVNIVDLAGRILVQISDLGTLEPLFIDPMDNGKLITEEECKDYILMRQIEWNHEFISPLSSRTILRRMIASMIFVLNKLRDERRLRYLRNYLEIIKG